MLSPPALSRQTADPRRQLWSYTRRQSPLPLSSVRNAMPQRRPPTTPKQVPPEPPPFDEYDLRDLLQRSGNRKRHYGSSVDVEGVLWSIHRWLPGQLTLPKLRQVIQALGAVDVSEADLERTFHYFDVDRNGCISYRELDQRLLALPPGRPGAADAPSLVPVAPPAAAHPAPLSSPPPGVLRPPLPPRAPTPPTPFRHTRARLSLNGQCPSPADREAVRGGRSSMHPSGWDEGAVNMWRERTLQTLDGAYQLGFHCADGVPGDAQLGLKLAIDHRHSQWMAGPPAHAPWQHLVQPLWLSEVAVSNGNAFC